MPQGVDEPVRGMLCAGTKVEDGNDLREGVDSQPQPQYVCGAAQPGAQLIQLDVGDLEVAEAALVQRLRVLTSARQPESDGGLTVAEDAFGGGSIQPFSECGQDHCDLVRGGFQAVQRGVAPSSERRAAGLTAKGLDALGMAMPAIPDQGVNVSVCDPGVRALLVGTGEALGVHPFRGSPAAFHLTPGSDRQRRWLYTRREGGGEATGWTIEGGAWLEKTVDRGAHLRCCSRVGRAMMLSP